MNAATIRHALPPSVGRVGIGHLAIRAGRALERWGRRHATPPTRAELARSCELRRNADGADRATRDLVFRATWRG